MITNPARAPTQQDTWRQREADHWDDRHNYSAYLDSTPADDGEGRLILVVAQMEARAAVMLAAVRAKSLDNV